MFSKLSYSGEEMVGDAVAVAMAGRRGFVSGQLSTYERQAAEAEALRARHQHSLEQANAANEALLAEVAKRGPHVDLDSVRQQYDQNHARARQHEIDAIKAETERDHLRRGVGAYAPLHRATNSATALLLTPLASDPREKFKKQMALAAATGVLQYGAQRALEAAVPGVSPAGSAAASAAGALAGRALVRGYDHYRGRPDAMKTSAWSSDLQSPRYSQETFMTAYDVGQYNALNVLGVKVALAQEEPGYFERTGLRAGVEGTLGGAVGGAGGMLLGAPLGAVVGGVSGAALGASVPRTGVGRILGGVGGLAGGAALGTLAGGIGGGLLGGALGGGAGVAHAGAAEIGGNPRTEHGLAREVGRGVGEGTLGTLGGMTVGTLGGALGGGLAAGGLGAYRAVRGARTTPGKIIGGMGAGLGGLALGGLAGGALGGLAGTALGGAGGYAHGAYASRRNQRNELAEEEARRLAAQGPA